MLKDEVMELRRHQQLLDAALEQVAEQAAKIEEPNQTLPLNILQTLEWVQIECANVESAIYELDQAVQTLESLVKKMEAAT